MQIFLSTLAQMTATLLAVLLAAVTAYFVFLQDRGTQFDDQIETARLELRDRLLQLRTTWPQGVGMYFPPDFRDTYRAQYSDKPDADFVMQAAIDFLFQNPPLIEAVERVRPHDSMPGPWQGRVYFVLLTEFVRVITVGSPDTRTTPERVFPSSEHGPGFTQWRVAFGKLRRILELLASLRPAMKRDFHEFTSKLPPELKPNAALSEEYYKNAVDDLFKVTEFVGTKVHDIEKLELSKGKYSFTARVNWRSTAALSSLTFILGVVVPMVLLTLPKLADSPVMGISLLLATLVLLFGAIGQFGWDVAKAPEADWETYLSGRYYVPLVEELKRQRANFDNGGLLDLDAFIDAQASEDVGRFPSQTRHALDEYVKAARAYNKDADEFNQSVIKAVRDNLTLGPLLVKGANTRGGVGVYPFALFDDTAHLRAVDSVSKTVQSADCRERDISLEVIMSRWTRVVARIPCAAFHGDPAPITRSLSDIRSELKHQPVAERLSGSRRAVVSGTQALQTVLGGM